MVTVVGEAGPAVTLFTTDTVLAALGLMQRVGITQLPVRDASGGYMGDVSEEELYRWWARAPLTRLAKVLDARLRGDAPPERKGERPRPLFDDRPARQRGWTH